jgi:hypothetical protein
MAVRQPNFSPLVVLLSDPTDRSFIDDVFQFFLDPTSILTTPHCGIAEEIVDDGASIVASIAIINAFER